MHSTTTYRATVSTTSAAQERTLQCLGIGASFRTDGSLGDRVELLQRGICCPVNWLHHGPVSAPCGSGHRILVVGWERAAPDARPLHRDQRGTGTATAVPA